ncbi:M20/M25/M40 family metallo-hydrolase [Gemmatimonadota bacterium]
MVFGARGLGLTLCVLAVLPACSGAPGGEGEALVAEVPDTLSREGRLRVNLGILAADSLEGRLTGTRGAAMAADFIARELESYGLEPAFAGSFLQPVPLLRLRREGGREQLTLGTDETLAELELTQGLGSLDRADDVNVGAVIRGLDPERENEVVIVGAHFDHMGIRAPRPGTPGEAEGDSVYNGADDDAAGVAAVLEVARAFALEGPGDRTVLFLLTTGEEVGALGTRWYIRNPAFPLEQTVADLQVEMIGRPDSLAGGTGRAWLTGYERSTLGETLAAQGVPWVPDPRPDQRFFFRSDNTPFAYEGIPAHTVSSFGLHADYHTPDDEVDRIDFAHMTSVVESLIRAVRILATGDVPQWTEGGRPQDPGGE